MFDFTEKYVWNLDENVKKLGVALHELFLLLLDYLTFIFKFKMASFKLLVLF